MNLRSVFTPNNILLVLLVAMLFFTPLLPIEQHFHAYSGLFSAILLASAFSLQTERRKSVLSIAVALVILEWVAIQINHSLLTAFTRVPQVLFFVIIVFGLIRQTATSKKVTERVIVDSISGYLLVGLVYAIVVFAIFRLHPDVLRFPEGTLDPAHLKGKMSDIVYYTFVTYTTTGYGDILPATPGMKSLGTLISATGQLYIAIIIALLVGKFASGVGKD